MSEDKALREKWDWGYQRHMKHININRSNEKYIRKYWY
jgi:hypothetical protein